MPEFVIMTKDGEKRLLDAGDVRHIKLFEEIGYRMTGKGFDEDSAALVEEGIQLPVLRLEKVLEQKLDKVIRILLD